MKVHHLDQFFRVEEGTGDAVLDGGRTAIRAGFAVVVPAGASHNIIVIVILAGTWGLFRQSLHMLFDGVPFEVDPGAVRQYLESLPDIQQVHDLHIWAMSTSQTALTTHLVMPAGPPGDVFLEEATRQLHDRFEIGHVTLQTTRAGFCQPCEAGVNRKNRALAFH